MPRTPSGGYDLPAGQPAISKTLITAEVHNDLANDLADALEDSLSRSGKGGMLVPFRVADGSPDAPAYSFTNSLSSGLFFNSSSRFVGISADRSAIAIFYPTRAVIDGELSAKMLKGTEQSDINMVTNTVALMTGSPTNTNIKIDTHQIQASDNGHASILDLNPHGGEVLVNGRPVKVATDEYFLKTEHVISSAGAVDAYKPIILDGAGKIHPSMIEIATFIFVGGFTPTAFDEYPDETGHDPGAFWVVENLTADYTFQSGDLAGQVAKNGNFMILGGSGWALSGDDIDPTIYYRLDGTSPITAPFAGGGFQIKDIADGTSSRDAVTLSQLNNLSGYYKLDGSLALTADFAAGDHKLRNVSDATDDSDAATLGQAKLRLLRDGSEAMTGDLHVGGSGLSAKSVFITPPNSEDSNLVLNRADGTKAGEFVTDITNDRLSIDKTDGSGSSQLRIELTADGKLLIDGHEAIHFGNAIVTSAGAADSGKPILLNSNGKVDDSMVSVSPMYLVGDFTPSAGTEYPDTTGETHGAFWQVVGLTAPYTFTGGDLAGDEIDNGDLMMWGTSSWVISRSTLDPTAYYRLDGTVPILADFAGGGYLIKQIANGVDDDDAATISQLSAKLDKTGKAADSSLFDGQSIGTFLRTSGDQTITGGITISHATNASVNLSATNGAVDEKNFTLSGDSDGSFNLKLKSDDNATTVVPIKILRTGVVADDIVFEASAFTVNADIKQKSGTLSIQNDASGVVSFEEADGTLRGSVGVNAAAGDNSVSLTAFNNDGSGSVVGSVIIDAATGATAFSNDISVAQNATITGELGVTGAITSQNDITAFSDSRIKTNLSPIHDAIWKVGCLNGYTFDRTDIETDRQTGLIAQEVRAILPEAVRENADGMLSIAYGNLAGLFVEAIKDLKSEIELLKSEIEEIRGS